MEHAIAGIWCETLGVDTVARNDNFFALGGTSLGVFHVIARLKRQCGVELSVEAFFDAATVRQLALVLEEGLPSNEIIGAI